MIGSRNSSPLASDGHAIRSPIAAAVPPHYAFSPTPAIATKGSAIGQLGDGEVAPSQSSHRSSNGLSQSLKHKIPSSSAAIRNGVSSHKIEDEDDEMAMLPMTPNLRGVIFAQPLVPSPSPLPASATGTRATQMQLQGNGDFPPVFFSPIPQGYLSARSSSHDNFLAAGSPSDITLRGGRLAAGYLNSEWEEGDSTPDTPREGEDSLSQPGTTPIPSSGLLSKKVRTVSSSSNLGKGSDSPRKAQATKAERLKKSSDADMAPFSSAKAMESGYFTSPEQIEETPSKSGEAIPPPPLTGSGAHNYLHPILSRPPASSPPDKGNSFKPASLLTQALPSKHSGQSLAPGALGSIAAATKAAALPRPNLKLVAGVSMIPHIDKVDKGGEDACCVCTRGMGSIGVADGVSGWAEEGIDPAEYSRTLMRFASEALESGPYPQGPDAREVIRYAHESTVMPGSSTVCIAVMKPGGKMQVANLGDSGVRVVRDGRVVFASTAQQHMFNMPYQLSHPSIIQSPDDADSADVTVLDIKVGDIIVLATDGLYDNVFDEESESTSH